MTNGIDAAQAVDRVPWSNTVAFSIYGAPQELGGPGHYAVVRHFLKRARFRPKTETMSDAACRCVEEPCPLRRINSVRGLTPNDGDRPGRLRCVSSHLSLASIGFATYRQGPNVDGHCVCKGHAIQRDYG